MRVALVTPGISADEGDWCVPALLDLVRALADRDQVTVFALRYPHTRTPYTLGGARVMPFGAAQHRGLGRLTMWLRAYLAIRRIAPGLDLVHALWAHEPAALALAAAHASGAPVVVSLLGGELVDLPEVDYGGLRDRGNRRLVRRALDRAAALTAGSEGLGREVRRRSGRPCAVLPLGIDPGRFRADGPARRLDGEPALLSVASLVPVKDHVTLLRAFARLGTARTARLHLVGEGPLRARLATLSGQLGVAERVHYHGAVDHDELAAYYRGADAMVVASRFESQSLAALEAAACGCPVLGTEVGILPELDAPTAPPGDADGLADLIAAALADPGALGALGTRQRARVLERFTVDTCVARLRRLYADVAAGRAA